MGTLFSNLHSEKLETVNMFSPLSRYPELQRKVRPRHMEVVHYLQYGHTWKPLRRAQRQQMKVMAASQHQKGEVILRNLAQELLTDGECASFKQALQHFRISKSVPTLCTQLKPVINSTEKLMLLLELSGKLPLQLQRDFHKLCSLQFSSYESFLKYFNTGNPLSNDPKVIAKDSSGQFQVVSTGFEKKIHVVPYEETNGTDGISLPGTSVTSGIYSEQDDVSRNGTVTNEETELILTHAPMKTPSRTPVQSRTHSLERSKTPTRISIQRSEGHSRKSSSHSNHQVNSVMTEHKQGETTAHSAKRKILLNRREDGSLGLGIKGGKEYGTPIRVYLVEDNSQAQEQGLKIGDEIMEVNGTDFSSITHAEAVTLMRNAWNLILVVETHNGQKDQHTPVQLTISDSTDIVIYPTNQGKLGCAVHRDPIGGDIIVKDVEANSPASKSGLKSGDYILKIDGLSVNILSEKQISSLTNSKHVKLNVKRPLFDKENFILRKSRTDTLGSDDVFTSLELPSPTSPRSPDVFMSTPRYANHQSNLFIKQTTSPYHTHNMATQTSDPNIWITENHNNDRHRVATIHRKYAQNYHSPRQHGSMPRMTMVYRSLLPSERSRSATRVKKPPMEFVRSRSQSPHSVRNTPSMTAEDRVVLHAVQNGIQKRQRALRLSLYQVPDAHDDDWRI